MQAPDFPTDGNVFKHGNLGVRYHGEVAPSRFLSARKKEERKMRYVEFVRSEGKYFLLVFKVKKDTTVPFFKVEICEDSVIMTADKSSEFRFYVDNEDLAMFDHEESEGRDDWVEILNGAITTLNAKSPSPQKTAAERSRSPIYARGGIDLDATLGTPAAGRATSSLFDGQPSSSLPPTTAARNRTLITSSEDGVGLNEPVRKIQKHIEPVSMISASGRSTPEPRLHASWDAEEIAPPPPGDSPLNGVHHMKMPQFSLSPETKGKHVPTSSEPSKAGQVVTRVGGDTTTPPRIPGVRGGSTTTSPEVTAKAIAAQPTAAVATIPVPSESTEHDDDHDHHHMSIGVLLHETQTLSAMNDELNEALERTESLLRATEEDHAYQMAHLRALLERARVEPDQLRAQLKEALDEKETISRLYAGSAGQMDLLRTEVRDLKAEKIAAEQIIHGLQDTITEHETKYAERNVEKIAQLEAALSTASHSLAERDAEVEELSNQLEAYSAMIREKEQEIRAEPLIARSEELSAKRVAMQQEIETLRLLLDRKDQEFIHDLGGTFANQVKAKMVPLSLNTKKLSMDLAAAQAAEESQRVSRVHLENVISQQESFIEQLEQKLQAAHAEASRVGELMQEAQMHKDDARSAALQRELAHKEKEELARRVTVLERELASQRDSFQSQMEIAEEEIFKQRAHVNKVGIEDSHLHAEVGILQRRVELGKEQYIQLETQLHEAQRQLVLESQHSAKKKESIQESLDAANQTVRELQSQVQSLEELLSAEQLDARRRIHEHEEVVTGLKRTNKDVAAKLSSSEEKAYRLELSLTSERMSSAHLKELNETLEGKLHSAAVKYTETVEDLEGAIAKHQKSLTEVRQQLRESEAQRRTVSEREGSAQREVTFSLKAAEDTNRALREEVASLVQERQNEMRAMDDRLAAQASLQERIEKKNLELERLLSANESERRVADQHHATREAELVAVNTDLTTQKEVLEVSLHKEKNELLRAMRSLEDAQTDIRNKTHVHDKLVKLHNEQLAANEALSEELAQAKRAHSALVSAHSVEVEGLQSIIRTLRLSGDESGNSLNARIQTLEDALLSTSRELKQTSDQLATTRTQLLDASEAKTALAASLAELQTESKIVATQLASQTSETTSLTQRVAELTHTRSTQNETIAALQEQVHQLQVENTQFNHKLDAAKGHAQATEDQLRDVLHRLETAEDRVHYLQDIAIPDLNNSAMETVERSKSEQNRFNAEIEALQRSIEQRERAAKELHARIHELENTESNLNQSYSTLSLKMGEMIPIKDYNHRLEQQRQANAVEIAELSTSKLNAVAERDEAVSKMTAVLQECRREAYTLRRIASNIAIHADADIRPREGRTLGAAAGASPLTTSKPVADIFNAAEETGSELREMVSLVNAFNESLLKDYIALRTSSVHQWFALHSEIIKGEPSLSSSSHSLAGSQSSSPAKDKDRDSHSAIPTASLNDLLQQNESMLSKLLNREKSAASRLTRQYEEVLAQKLQCEARIVDLQVRMEGLEAHLVDVENSKMSTDNRCSAEVSALQQRLSQLMADLDRRQDEYSEMVSGLTKSHEDQLQRQASHLSSVAEQRLSEISLKAKLRNEELEQRLRSTEASLKAELDEARREHGRQVDLHQHLENELAHRNAEANTFYARLDTLQAELDDRTSQLEGSLSQLEKAELKAAKEARQRLELERTLRRFKNPSITSGATSHSAVSPSEEIHRAHEREREQNRDAASDHGTVRCNATGRAGLSASGAASAASVSSRVPLATYARDRSAFDHSFDGNASVNSTSLAVEDLNDTPDLRLSHGARGSTATPLHRSALLRTTTVATPEASFPQREHTRYSSLNANGLSSYSLQSTPAATSADARGSSLLTSRSLTAGLRGSEHLDVSRRYTGSVTSTIQSAYSSPDQSPEPVTVSRSLLTHSAHQAELNASNGVSGSAFDRAFLATSRIEQAMKAKGWKLNK